MFRLTVTRALDDSYVYLYRSAIRPWSRPFDAASDPDGVVGADWPGVQDRQNFVEHDEDSSICGSTIRRATYRLCRHQPMPSRRWRTGWRLTAHRDDVRMLSATQFFAITTS